jgi:hypothetical protein
MVEAGELQFGTAKLELGSLATINHEEFLTDIYYL